MHPHVGDVPCLYHSYQIFIMFAKSGDSVSLSFFSEVKTESQSLQVLWKTSIIETMARPFFKTSGCGCTVNSDFASLYLRRLVDDFYMQGMRI